MIIILNQLLCLLRRTIIIQNHQSKIRAVILAPVTWGFLFVGEWVD